MPRLKSFSVQPDAPNSKQRLGAFVRDQFPIFTRVKHHDGKVLPLSYLDSAASSQKHQSVIDRLGTYLAREHANIHRGAYDLSAAATDSYENAREAVARFIGAEAREVVFTRGTTESINLVARSLERWFNPGDTILLTLLEHHSNIVPWQLLAERRGLKIAFADIRPDATLNTDDFFEKLKVLKPRFVSFTAMANSFGTLTPAAELTAAAREAGAVVLVDAAQSVAHQVIDVKALGADFLAFSGHKMYGPTGVGGLYVRYPMYDCMEPFLGGGDMIRTVTTEGSTWAEPPQKFEAGTPAIAEVIALERAVAFLESVGRDRIAEHEAQVLSYGIDVLSREPHVQLYGPAGSGNSGQASIIAFNVEGVHPHDLSSVADSFNVQIRAGHHCAMPALKRLNLPSSARASVGVYSVNEDFDYLREAIRRARKIFS